MGIRPNGTCGIEFVCDACGGTGCDHCRDTGRVACPCAAGEYVHSVAERGETCAYCGERFGNGMDVLRSAPIPVIGDAPIIFPQGWHVGCR